MGMKIQTFSVVVGDTSCNAHCPFCVSKMTPECSVDETESPNYRNFEISCQYAKDSRVSTVLMTGKGEPLLKKNKTELLSYLQIMYKYKFPFIEIQTNGTEIMNISDIDLKQMYNLGVTTFIISCVHYDQDKNKEIYNKDYPDLEKLVAFLHEI
jgi:MoaA/NifB/PqqE/SkfB family radical SAM enzyme